LDEHNVRCINIDECAIMHGVCGNGTCIDVPGSFTCKCDPGKLLDFLEISFAFLPYYPTI
jgi:hypothetical protein